MTTKEGNVAAYVFTIGLCLALLNVAYCDDYDTAAEARDIVVNDGAYSNSLSSTSDVDWHMTRVVGPGDLTWTIKSFSGGPRIRYIVYKSAGDNSGDVSREEGVVFPTLEWDAPSDGAISVPSGTHTYYLYITGVSGYLDNGLYSVTASGSVTPAPEPLELVDADCYIDPTTQAPDGQITVYYRIYNPNSASQTAGLGCSIRPVGSGDDAWISDKNNDTTVTVEDGYSTQSRSFHIKPEVSPGAYEVGWGLWDGEVAASNMVDSVVKNTLTVADALQVESVVMTINGSAGPVTVNAGEQIELSASISGVGSGTVTYHWEYRATSDTSWTQGSDLTVQMTSGSATIGPIMDTLPASEGSWLYRMVVTNPSTVQSNQVEVTVMGETPTRFGGSLFGDVSTSVGVPVLLQAKLEKDTLGNPDIEGQEIYFQVYRGGSWEDIEEDGISTTSLTTDVEGIGRVYYLPPEDMVSDEYEIRAVYDGNAQYLSTEGTATLALGLSGVESTINGNTVGWILMNGRTAITGIPQTGVRDKTPLILVHGNRNEDELNGMWTTYLDWIEDHPEDYADFDVFVWKHDTSKAIGFNGNTGNAKELANCIHDYLLPYYQPGTKVLFLAHSRGGLVCRAFMNYDHQGDDVLGLITLGTPHHGSPLAIPDWTAVLWAWKVGTAPAQTISYDLLVGVEGRGVDTDRLGDLNLAWDNRDGAVSGVTSVAFDTSFSADGQVYLTSRDTNVQGAYSDSTILYSDIYKTAFGTLGSLNQIEAYGDKIVAFAAFDDTLADNPPWGRFVDMVANLVGSALSDHYGLSALTVLVARSSEYVVSNSAVYYANDGMVPLQSALLLDISGGEPFSSVSADLTVTPQYVNISSAQQVKRHRIFNGREHNIKDHLDLLETTNSSYWTALTADVRDFLPGSLTVSISPQAVIDAGAQWRVDGGAWRNSGYVETGFSTGEHSVEFKQVTGWNTPNPGTVVISSDQIVELSGEYTPEGDLTGSLQVTITPTEAIADGALWRVDGGPWQSSGDIVSGLASGDHTLTFTIIPGWIRPVSETVTIDAGETTSIARNYTRQQHTLSVSSTGQGSVSLDPGGGTYDYGTTVQLSASASSGWHFVRWEGHLSGTSPSTSILMDEDKSVTAVFEEDAAQYTLSVTVQGQGSVSLIPADTMYDAGTNVQLEAVPSTGWEFDRWEGDLGGSSNPTSIEMNGNKAVTAVFTEVPQYSLQTAVQGQGAVLLDPPGGLYDANIEVTLTAQPDADWLFDHWEGDAPGEVVIPEWIWQNPLGGYQMDRDKAIAAVFVPADQVAAPTFLPTESEFTDFVDVSITSGTADAAIRYTTDGTTPSSTEGTEYDGTIHLTETTTIRAIAYKDGMADSDIASKTYTQSAEYTLSTVVQGLGTISLNPPGEVYTADTEITLTAKADEGWRFDRWQGDGPGEVVTPEWIWQNPLTGYTMDKDKSIAAVFVPDEGSLNWVQDGTIPLARSLHGVGPVGEDVLVFGGRVDESQQYTQSVGLYQSGGGWTDKESMPEGRWGMAFTMHDGKAYSIAGYSPDYVSGSSGGLWGRTVHVWSYDPVADTWTAGPSLAYERDNAAGASLGDYVYVVGGHHEDTGHGFSIANVERYNPTAGGSWESVASLNYPREHLAAAVVNGKIYAIGGYTYDYPSHPASWDGHMETYDPGANEWTDGPTMLTPRSAFAVTVIGDRIYTIGGKTSTAGSSVVEYFDVSENAWFGDTSLPEPLYGARAVTVGGNIYVVGGETAADVRSNVVYSASVTDSSAAAPIIHWSFDDASDPGHDDSGNGHDLTIPGSRTTVLGVIGNAVSFVDYGVSTNTGSSPLGPYTSMTGVSYPGQNGFSVACWVQATDQHQEFVEDYWQHVAGGQTFWLWNRPEANGFEFMVRDDYDNAPEALFADSSSYVGEWVHLAGVYASEGYERMLYVNGELQASDVLPSPMRAEQPPNLYVSGNWHKTYPETIDEVRIYDRALLVGEIAQLANRPFTGDVGGAVYTDAASPLASGLEGVTVMVTGGGTAFEATTAGTQGIWQVNNVPEGTYTVTPGLTGYTFEHMASNQSDGQSSIQIVVNVDTAEANGSIQFLAKPSVKLHDWNGDGIISIIGDVPPFVDCVYFGNCPDGADRIAVGDCNGDGIISIVGDVPCFVGCVYFGNCP